nr:hypothetical protein BaRGS_006072 [Batillaria attramentaria]
MKDIDADYYGYRDEDDGRIVPAEQEAEKIAIAQKVSEWKERVAKIASGEIARDADMDPEENLYPPEEVEMEEREETTTEAEKEHFIAHVPVPSQQEIEAALVQRKKMELLKKYASDSLMEEEETVKKMLGV